MQWLQVGAVVGLFVVWASAVLVVLAILSVGRRNEDMPSSPSARLGGSAGMNAGLAGPAGGEFDEFTVRGLRDSAAPAGFRRR